MQIGIFVLVLIPIQKNRGIEKNKRKKVNRKKKVLVIIIIRYSYSLLNKEIEENKNKQKVRVSLFKIQGVIGLFSSQAGLYRTPSFSYQITYFYNSRKDQIHLMTCLTDIFKII